MDKTMVGVFGAMAALASLDTAQAATEPAAAPTELTAAKSFAELLDPIPNALATLRAADAAAASTPKVEGVQVAQYYYYYHHHHHHHHHHHRYWRGY